MEHRHPPSEVKHLIFLQICNVNTKIKFSQSPQFCFVSGEKSDEYLPETTTSLGECSVNPDRQKYCPSFSFCSETFAEL